MPYGRIGSGDRHIGEDHVRGVEICRGEVFDDQHPGRPLTVVGEPDPQPGCDVVRQGLDLFERGEAKIAHINLVAPILPILDPVLAQIVDVLEHEGIKAQPAEQEIIVRPAVQDVILLPAVEPIDASPTQQGVLSTIAEQCVVVFLTAQLIIARAAQKPVVA